jgi:glc operon protein GlcG
MHKRSFLSFLCMTAMLAASGIAFGQEKPTAAVPPSPPQYGPAISLEKAREIATAARAEAQTKGWSMAITIVGNGGELIYFEKMDDTQTGSIEVSMAKARTAALFKRPTKVFSDAVAGGASSLLSMPGVIAVSGGAPLMSHGKMVGALGVSGGTSAQDAAIADSGLRVKLD